MTTKKLTLLFTILLTLSTNIFAQGVGINENGATADESAILDVSSTSQGFLLPRMTQSERDAITNPAAGLMIYNTTTSCFNYYTGDVWAFFYGTSECECQDHGGSNCSAAYDLGNVCGDMNSSTIVELGCDDGWFKVMLDECDTGLLTTVDLTIEVILSSTLGSNYDLYLYEPCGNLVGSSTNGTGVQDMVTLSIEDTYGVDDSRYIYIMIQVESKTECDDWTMNISGNIE